MRCLILLVIVAAIYVSAIFSVGLTGEYYFIFSFSALPLLAALFFFSSLEAAVVAIAALLLALTFIFLPVSIFLVLETFIFLAICLLAGYYIKNLNNRAITIKEKVLNVVKEEYESFCERKTKTQDARPGLEKSVSDISVLYEAIKDMLSSTSIEELFGSLQKTLKDHNFVFKNAYAILFSFKEKEPKIEKVYPVLESGSEDALAGYGDFLVELTKARKTALVIDTALGNDMPKEIKIPDGVETFVAIPLLGGEKANGIFVVENIVRDDIVRCAILVHQFSMVLERIRLYELVHELAITDGLTRAFVRRYLLERLREEIERAKNFNMHLSFMMVDIDHFKRCNDKYGHLVGDVILREIAQILKKSVREIDLVGRYGGEEFSIVLPETNKNDALVVGERLRKAVEAAEISAYDEKIRTTISMGISAFPDDASDLAQLIDRADQMLYKAKEDGRNRTRVHE